MIKGFTYFPWAARLARGHLDITPGEINADGQTEHMVGRIGQINVAPALADRQDQLDFILQILGEWRIGYLRSIWNDGICGFLEKEGRIAFVSAHFADMSGIIAPHAINPTHGKAGLRARNGNGNLGWRREAIFSHFRAAP
jgi:hypothetical protein